MARIVDSPRSPLVGQVERKSVELPKLNPPPATLLELKTKEPGSRFVDRKARLVAFTGTNPALVPKTVSNPNQDLKDFVATQMRASVTAGPAGNTLSIKGGETGAATRAPQTPQALEKSLAKKTMEQINDAVGVLGPPQKAALGKAIESGKVTDPRVIAAFMQQQNPADRAKTLEKLPAKQLEGLKELMRTGDCPNDVGVGVGLRMAAETKWGKANPDVVKTMKKAYSEGKMVLVAGDQKIAGLGQTTASGISVANQLRKSPEAMAATLAHEGTHMHSGSGCCSGGNDATPEGELAGMGATAEVWRDLGKTTDPNLSPGSLKLLNDVAAAKKDPKEFKNVVLGFYTNFYQEKRDAVGAAVNRGNDRYAKFKKAHKDMPTAELDKLMDNQSQLEYLEKTAETFRAAWNKKD